MVKVIGAILTAAPFIGFGALIWHEHGWRAVAVVFCMTASIIACVGTGVYLLAL